MKNEFDKLIYDTVKSEFSLSFISQFNELMNCNPYDKILQYKCLSWIAIIYHENKRHEDSVSIYLELVKVKSLVPDMFPTILLNLLNQLKQLNRKEEAKILFEEHFQTDQIHGFNALLGLLNWYVETFNANKLMLNNFSYIITKIEKEIGYHSKKKNPEDQIRELFLANYNAARQYENINFDYPTKSKDDKLELLNNFIDSDIPEFYRKIAKKQLSYETLRK